MHYLRNQVAKMAKINVETLRYYEQSGLLPTPIRNENGYRLYDNNTIEMLETIQYAKACGFTLEEIKSILTIVNDQVIDYDSIIGSINEKINHIDEKIGHLNNIKAILDKIKINIEDQTSCPIKTTFKNL